MADETRARLDRRTMLRGAGLAAVAVASVAPQKEAQAYDPGEPETRARYRADSPEVQAFYRTNGYEALKKG